VYAVVRKIDPSLVTLAHEGTRAYCESFDLVHRREAEAPNAIWQADHSELDILVNDEKGNPRKPWLTIILDDHSRAAAGYFLSFHAPSAFQTALALRQAIWRKTVPAWNVNGTGALTSAPELQRWSSQSEDTIHIKMMIFRLLQ
jgi:putative transposase